MGGTKKTLEKVVGAFGQPDDTQLNEASVKLVGAAIKSLIASAYASPERQALADTFRTTGYSVEYTTFGRTDTAGFRS